MTRARPKPKQDHQHDDESSESDGLSGEAEGRTLHLVGYVTERRVGAIIQGLFLLAERSQELPIYLVVNTYGGSIDDTFALYDAIQMVPNQIRTIGLGKVMSAGCLILASGEKGNRLMGKNARLMYHGGYDVNDGDIFTQENNLDEFKRQEKQYDNLVARETGRGLKHVERLYKGHRLDRYLTAEQARKFGFCDRVC